MPRITATDQTWSTRAQYLVAAHLVRACQGAIYDLATDEDKEPEARHEAIGILKEILVDWIAARRALREEMTSSRVPATFTAR
jgi:hypothetical protein